MSLPECFVRIKPRNGGENVRKAKVLSSLLIATTFLSPVSALADDGGYTIQYFDSEADYFNNKGGSGSFVSGGSSGMSGGIYESGYGDSYVNATEGYQPDYIGGESLGSDIIYVTEQPTAELWSRDPLANPYSANQYRWGNNVRPVTIVINGRKCTPRDTPAIVIDGRVFVPLRFVAEELGYTVSWDEENMTAEINDGAIKIEVGSYTMWKYDAMTIPTDTPPFFYQGTLMVGLRQIGNALNYNVKWDAAKKIAYLERAVPNNNLYQHNVFDRSK